MSVLGALVIFFVSYILLRPIIKGAVYFPTFPKNIEKIIKLADLKNGKMADLGSGDGRVIMAFAKKGIESHGYEINPLLVLFSKIRIRKNGLRGKAFAHWRSFWRVNFSEFDLVYVYGFPNIMDSLGDKLNSELQIGTKIISNAYQFSNLSQAENENSIYLYLK
jgi:hypothetical protein